MIFLIFVFCVFLILGYFYITNHKPNLEFYVGENFYKAEDSTEKEFPSLFDTPSKYLSVIVPAYNEEDRISIMLNECIDYLENRKIQDNNFTYEVIIVDDGSRDKTTQIGLEYTNKKGSDKVRVVTLLRNRGKGQAIKLGTLCSRGNLILFADADGATKFSDFTKLESTLINALDPNNAHLTNPNLSSYLQSKPILICGSRAHLESEVLVKRSFFRNLLMIGFKQWVSWIGGITGIKDTQCGFKLMNRCCARLVFPNLHIERWAFDVELLYIAAALGAKIYETPVNWHEIAGSKIVPIFSWLQMARDILLIRLRYMFGFWSLNPHPAKENIEFITLFEAPTSKFTKSH